MRACDLKIGIHIVHAYTGDYLGQVVHIGHSGRVCIYEGGKRGRGIATIYDINKVERPPHGAIA